MLAKMEQYHYPGLQACIVKDAQIIWKGNYGYADLEQSKLVDDSTLFLIMSTSKPVTGTAIMQLWEKGLFELDNDVNDYLPFEVRNPSYPDDSITFRMLLSHTSGITDNWTIYPDLDDLVTWGADSPLLLGSFLENYLFEGGAYYTSNSWSGQVPGSAYNYTSVGITLLGYLVETIADTSFEGYSQENIFGPLGMNETSWFLANLDREKIATPYTYSGDTYHPSNHWGETTYPGSQIRTSAAQLARFLMAFIQKGQMDDVRILESATVDSMTVVQNPELSHVGLTWFIREHNIPRVGLKLICAHTGTRRFGANAAFGFEMGGENVGTIVLVNGVNDDGMVDISYELMSYGIITDIEKEITNFPKNIFLSQNYPNPFNPSTTIEFALPRYENVKIEVYNTLGQRVEILLNQHMRTGHHEVEFNAQNLSSGIYFYRIEAGEFQDVKKMVLLK
jgi:CubicO group peptidase (beta-lactamase class C family)